MAQPTAPKTVTYADAGVDLRSGDHAKERIKYLAQKTFNRNVLGGIGSFGALYRLDMQRWKNPILVSSADGVGTKLKVAFQLGLHQTVGVDLVNHCVNDIAVQGATPLFFLDYLATGKLDEDVVESVVSGLADACKANGCVLIGGETAQMPGFYADGEYDLAGFIVGAVDRDKMITGAGIKAGDVLIGLPSTGLHTNGYSLARKLLFEVAGYKATQYVTAIKEKAGATLKPGPHCSRRGPPRISIAFGQNYPLSTSAESFAASLAKRGRPGTNARFKSMTQPAARRPVTGAIMLAPARLLTRYRNRP